MVINFNLHNNIKSNGSLIQCVSDDVATSILSKLNKDQLKICKFVSKKWNSTCTYICAKRKFNSYVRPLKDIVQLTQNHLIENSQDKLVELKDFENKLVFKTKNLQSGAVKWIADFSLRKKCAFIVENALNQTDRSFSKDLIKTYVKYGFLIEAEALISKYYHSFFKDGFKEMIKEFWNSGYYDSVLQLIKCLEKSESFVVASAIATLDVKQLKTIQLKKYAQLALDFGEFTEHFIEHVLKLLVARGRIDIARDFAKKIKSPNLKERCLTFSNILVSKL